MKKIFAKEVLVLLVCLSLTLLSFFVVQIFNYYQQYTIDKNVSLVIENEKFISELQKEYKPKIEKQSRIYKGLISNYNLEKHNSPSKVWKRTKDLIGKDSMRNVFQSNESFEKTFFTVLEVNNYEDFTVNFKINTLTPIDSLNQLKSDSLISVNNNLTSYNGIVQNKMFNKIEKKQFIFNFFLITLFISFGLRYFILLFKWSINNYK
jgi:hypothetical protein